MFLHFNQIDTDFNDLQKFLKYSRFSVLDSELDERLRKDVVTC